MQDEEYKNTKARPSAKVEHGESDGTYGGGFYQLKIKHADPWQKEIEERLDRIEAKIAEIGREISGLRF